MALTTEQAAALACEVVEGALAGLKQLIETGKWAVAA